MALIDYPVLDECDPETRAVLSQLSRDGDEIPSFPLMLATDPQLLKAALGQFGEVMYGGRLDPTLKQLAFVVVSQHNACAYCAASHGEELVDALGVDTSHLQALAAGDDGGLTPPQRAVAAFARRVADDPKAVGRGELDTLRAAGFDDADVVELVAVLGQANFANTVADALGIAPADQSPRLEQYVPKPAPA